MKIKSLGKAVVMLSCVLALTACGSSGGNQQTSAKPTLETSKEILKKHPMVIKNDGNPIKDGVLKIAYVSDTQFKGVLNAFLATDANDSAMVGPMSGAFPTNKNYSIKLDDKNTPIDVHVDKDAKKLVLKINPKFKWSNGEPVSTADIVRTIEIAANQKYIVAAQSPRFGGNMLLIKGIDEYNKGKADKISGLEVKSPSEMSVQLTKMTESGVWGGVLPSEFVNAKQFANIPMDKIQTSDALRKNPLSYGAYVVKSIVPGEKIVYEANPYYYKGEPKVKKLEMVVLPTSQQVAAAKAGKFDLITGPSRNVFPKMEALNNVKLTLSPSLSYSYVGFKMGTWDAKTSSVKYNPKAKMSDKALREAIGYAMNVDQVAAKFNNGLSFRISTPIIPAFEGLCDTSIQGYPLDLDKANKILDEAGYKKGKDGFRTDKNGKPLVLNFSMMKGSSINEAISENYMQQWKKIGLNVKLVDGRLLDMNDFYQRIQNDAPGIDFFIAAWSTGSDPNPTGFYGSNEPFNLQRYENPELTKALDKINSPESISGDKMKEAFFNFQKIFYDQAVCIPVTGGYDYTVVNNRVKMYDNTPGTSFDYSDVELIDSAPHAAK